MAEINDLKRYFFDVLNGHGLVVDEIGQILRDPEQARIEALHTIQGIANDEMFDDTSVAVVVSVRDDSGTKIFEASLAVMSGWIAAS